MLSIQMRQVSIKNVFDWNVTQYFVRISCLAVKKKTFLNEQLVNFLNYIMDMFKIIQLNSPFFSTNNVTLESQNGC